MGTPHSLDLKDWSLTTRCNVIPSTPLWGVCLISLQGVQLGHSKPCQQGKFYSFPGKLYIYIYIYIYILESNMHFQHWITFLWFHFYLLSYFDHTSTWCKYSHINLEVLLEHYRKKLWSSNDCCQKYSCPSKCNASKRKMCHKV